MVDNDMVILRRLLAAQTLNEKWIAVDATITHRVLQGHDALDVLLHDDDALCRGWIVRTDSVLYFDGHSWLTRRSALASGSLSRRLLHAELAFSDLRGVRISLLRDQNWHCEEVTEGRGKRYLSVYTTQSVEWGTLPPSRYRVYWGQRPAARDAEQPGCYQPIACRWAVEDL